MPRGDGSVIAAGVIGAGVFGRYHALKYRDSAFADLVAVYDADPARAEALASETGARACPDLDSFLGAVSAVSLAAPASVHADIADRILASGKHCLVEKPLALTVADADRLIALARDAGVVLQVGHQERFVADAHRLVRHGHDARRLSFRRFGPRTGRCEDVSVVWDLMIHDLDLARQFGFGEPVAIEARGDADIAAAVFSFEGGRSIDFSASRCASRVERTLTIEGPGEPLVFDFQSHSFAGDADAAPVKNEATRDPVGFGVRDFLNAIRQERAPIVSGEDGRDAVAWAEAVERALLEGALSAPDAAFDAVA